MSRLTEFARGYQSLSAERQARGIPPLPLDKKQTIALCELLKDEDLDPKTFILEGQDDTAGSLLHLLTERVPPGVTDASFIKADFLGGVVQGKILCPYVSPSDAVRILGQMGGGANIPHLVDALGLEDVIAKGAASALSSLILVPPLALSDITAMAGGGNRYAADLLKSWAEADWFAQAPALP